MMLVTILNPVENHEFIEICIQHIKKKSKGEDLLHYFLGIDPFLSNFAINIIIGVIKAYSISIWLKYPYNNQYMGTKSR